MTKDPPAAKPPRNRGPTFFAAAVAALAPAAVLAQTAPASAPAHPTNPEDQLYDRFDRIHFNNGFSSHYYYTIPDFAQPIPVFLPPVPPPLEADLRILPPPASGPVAPPELEPYVRDIFYPVLASRLAADSLPGDLRRELQAYATAKAALQDELRGRIASLKNTDADQRERELEKFAAVQTPRIAALEGTADRIRAELQRTGPFGLPVGPARSRGIAAREGPGPEARPAADDLRRQARSARLAAYFDESLAPMQRRLLAEAALDLDAQARRTAEILPAATPELVDFSPEGARISLPAELPAPLAQAIDRYQAERRRLKQALLEAVRQNLDAGRDRRAEAMSQLAASEAPEVAALEAAAEEIRRALAVIPDPPGPPPPPALPVELANRISNYRAHKVALLKTLYGLLVGAPAAPAARDGGDAALPWLRDGTTPTPVVPANLAVSADEFNRRQAALLGELNTELAGIRASLSEYVRATHQPTDHKSINDLLRDFEQARQRQEIWDQYRDYQAAVLLPGLSPEQRRLLFDAAIVRLGLPLPSAERLE